MSEKRLAIRITSTFSGTGAKQAETSVTGLNSALGSLGKVAAAVGGTGLLLKVGSDAIQMASDVEEAASKFAYVFGPAAESVSGQLDTFAESANRSSYQLQAMAADVGAMTEAMLGSKSAAGSLSVDITKLAVDLASFNNVTEEDALGALKAGLIGESEPMRRFGVLLSEAAVTERIFADGMAKTKGEITDAMKVQARFNIIMEQTATAQGDAERTSDSYANQVRGLTADAQDLGVEFGQKLIPATLTLVETLGLLINEANTSSGALDSVFATAEEGANRVKFLAERLIDGKRSLEAMTESGGTAGQVLNVLQELWKFGPGLLTEYNRVVINAALNLLGYKEAQAAAAQAEKAAEAAHFDAAEALEVGALAAQAAVADQTMLARAVNVTDEAVSEVAGRTLPEFTDEMRKASIEAGEAASWEAEMAEAMGEANLMTAAQTQAFVANQIAMQMHNAEAARVVASNSAIVAGFQAAEQPVQAWLTALEQSNGAQGEWVTVTRTNAGEIGEISEQLAGDLDEDQRDAWEEILKTTGEGSAEWLGAWKALQGDLTASQRAELIAQRADLEAAGDTIGSAYTGSIADMTAAKDAAIEANNAIIASYQQVALEGALALAAESDDRFAVERALDYAVAIGAISQAEADMRLEVGNTQIELGKLNTILAEDTTISAEAAAAAYDLLVSGQAKTVEEALRLVEEIPKATGTMADLTAEVPKAAQAFLDMIPGMDGVINRLNGLDGRTVRVTTIYDTVGSPPGDLGGGPTGPGKVEEKAVGGAVFPNRPYIVGERGPELFRPSSPGTIIPNNQMGGSGGINVNGPLIGSITQLPGESAEMLANRISTILARRTRQIRVAGG